MVPKVPQECDIPSPPEPPTCPLTVDASPLSRVKNEQVYSPNREHASLGSVVPFSLKNL